VLHLGVPPTVARSLRSTNCVKSLALRWCAGMVEATTQFRRVNGHLHLRSLHTALERHVATENVSVNEHNHISNAA
jgi:putative transposase